MQTRKNFSNKAKKKVRRTKKNQRGGGLRERQYLAQLVGDIDTARPGRAMRNATTKAMRFMTSTQSGNPGAYGQPRRSQAKAAGLAGQQSVQPPRNRPH